MSSRNLHLTSPQPGRTSHDTSRGKVELVPQHRKNSEIKMIKCLLLSVVYWKKSWISAFILSFAFSFPPGASWKETFNHFRSLNAPRGASSTSARLPICFRCLWSLVSYHHHHGCPCRIKHQTSNCSEFVSKLLKRWWNNFPISTPTRPTATRAIVKPSEREKKKINPVSRNIIWNCNFNTRQCCRRRMKSVRSPPAHLHWRPARVGFIRADPSGLSPLVHFCFSLTDSGLP